MKDYILYTVEGYTFAPDNTQFGNCQILSFERASSKEEARESFYANNDDFLLHGFTKEEIRCVEIAGFDR